MPQAKQVAQAPKQKNALIRFFSETIAEMKKVTWLTRREMVYLTSLVLLVAVAAGIVLGLFDWGFSEFINKLILGG
jgi:preprotein translocase subunit SecE